MILAIDNNKKIKEVQEEFNKLFPYLKLEFFTKKHRMGEATAKKYMKQVINKKLADFISTSNDNNLLEISPQMSVAFLEELFKTIYGLNVQVFRKSGKVWLETTFTDGWSLEEQNLQGEALSKSVM